jgi:hypothetical protein
MLHQARFWGSLDDSLRECAGMLRRRMPAGTVLGVLGVCAAFVLLGADALARDPTLLVAALVGTLALALATRRLERRNRARRRPRFVSAREFIDACADAGVERRLFPDPAEPLLRPQDVGVRGEDRIERGIDRGVQRFGRYYPLHEAPVECVPGTDGFAGQHEPARSPGADLSRQ